MFLRFKYCSLRCTLVLLPRRLKHENLRVFVIVFHFLSHFVFSPWDVALPFHLPGSFPPPYPLHSRAPWFSCPRLPDEVLHRHRRPNRGHRAPRPGGRLLPTSAPAFAPRPSSAFFLCSSPATSSRSYPPPRVCRLGASRPARASSCTSSSTDFFFVGCTPTQKIIGRRTYIPP